MDNSLTWFGTSTGKVALCRGHTDIDHVIQRLPRTVGAENMYGVFLVSLLPGYDLENV